MTPEQALALIRNAPEKAFLECAFSATVMPGIAPVYAGVPDCGGQARVRIEPLLYADKDIFKITITEYIRGTMPGTDIYFYPYTNQRANVGFCFVPVDCPNGTIVFTSGMNGCALRVNKTADRRNFIFMHDRDGVSINRYGPALVGNINLAYRSTADYRRYGVNAIPGPMPASVLRIESGGYMDLVIDDLDGKYTDLVYCNVAVKRAGIWEIYSSSILTESNMLTYKFHRGSVESKHAVRCIGIFERQIPTHQRKASVKMGALCILPKADLEGYGPRIQMRNG